MIPQEKIQEIIANTDLEGLVGQYVTLKRTGGNLKGLCPFHQEKTPSFVVTPHKGIFKCFGCGAAGGPIQFLMKIENLDFLEAVKVLAEKLGVVLETTPAQRKALTEKEQILGIMKIAVDFYCQQLQSPLGKTAMGYLKARGIPPEAVTRFRLGFAPVTGNFLIRHLSGRRADLSVAQRAGIIRRGTGDYYDYFRNRIIFPINDSQGRPVGMGGRVMENDEGPKYLNTPESPVFQKRNLLYGLDLAKAHIRKDQEVFIVEGYMDAIALFGAGIENVAASMGTALSEEQAALCGRYAGKVIFAYDADTAGAAATIRGIEIFENEGLSVRVMSMPKGEDPDSVIRKKGVDFFRKLAARAVGIVDYKIGVLRKTLDMETPEGKEQFVAQVSPLLLKVKGDIRRSEYIRIIAERYRIPEDLLRQKVSDRKIRKTAVDISPVMKKKRLSPPEQLLSLLFSKPSFIELCRNYDYFNEKHMEPDLLTLFRGLLSLDTGGLEAITSRELYRIAENEEILKKAVDLSMVEGQPAVSEEEIVAILREIDIREKKRRIADIQEKVSRRMEQGVLTPDDPDFAEYNRLLLQIRGPRQ